MTTPVISFLAAAIHLMIGAPAWSHPIGQKEFFRILAEGTEPMPVESFDGRWLSVSGGEVGGFYLIERSHDLLNWSPFTRNAVPPHDFRVKLVETDPPPGMVFIPGGHFAMGDTLGDLDRARPVHTVVVSPFFMNIHEVTVGQFARGLQEAFSRGWISLTPDETTVVDPVGKPITRLKQFDAQIVFNGGRFSVKPEQEDYPAIYVTWYGAALYCNILSTLEDREVVYNLENWSYDLNARGYRLPTEAEWEFAARGGREGGRFPWADVETITHAQANYRSAPAPNSGILPPYDISPTSDFHPVYGSKRPRSSPVGTFAPNPFGLFDMCGNAWEWVNDRARGRYDSGHQVDPSGPGPEAGETAVFRGGSFHTTAERNTVFARYVAAERADIIYDVGFRIVIPDREAP